MCCLSGSDLCSDQNSRDLEQDPGAGFEVAAISAMFLRECMIDM